jgi:hypothetical protein
VTMKIITIKSFLIFICILYLAFAFPMQVLNMSVMPVIFPYLVLVCVFLLTLMQRPYLLQLRLNARKPIVIFISIYLTLVLSHTIWQVIFGIITPEEGVSAIVNFVFPVAFFCYFRTIATNQEFRAVFIAVIVASLVIGAYFIYDSYSMLILRQLNDYAIKAYEYSQFRAPDAELNDARISIGYRSHGLLEIHAFSAGWIVIGCLATLTLLPKRQSKKRMVVIFLYGTMLLIGLNFTSILGFSFVIILIEFEGYKFLRGVIPKKIFHLLIFVILSFCISVLVLLALPSSIGIDMYEEIKRMIDIQTSIAGGSAKLDNGSTYIGGLIDGFVALPYSMLAFPAGILIGMGYSSFSISYGDYGILANITRLGFPFALAIIIGLLIIIIRAVKKIESYSFDNYSGINYLWFATTTTVYMIFVDLHYSILIAKSIMPILFFNLAIFDRYLYQQRNSSTSQKFGTSRRLRNRRSI